jgi:hypothetical protein
MGKGHGPIDKGRICELMADEFDSTARSTVQFDWARAGHIFREAPGHVYPNWLQVFRSADAARSGQRERYAQKNAGYVVAARGPDMRLTAIFFGPYAPEAHTA